MVGDFLDAARIESGHLELQLRRRDLRELAQEAVELYGASSRAHRLVYSPAETPVEVRCDAERIAQVLNNLVSNAIKYSPQGGDVRVSVTASKGDAIVAVQDSGIGIAPEDQKHIFEPFRRTGASRDTAPGVGLGLSVAHQIIEAHGGRIDVESTLGVGSTFRVHRRSPAPRRGTRQPPRRRRERGRWISGCARSRRRISHERQRWCDPIEGLARANHEGRRDSLRRVSPSGFSTRTR